MLCTRDGAKRGLRKLGQFCATQEEENPAEPKAAVAKRAAFRMESMEKSALAPQIVAQPAKIQKLDADTAVRRRVLGSGRDTGATCSHLPRHRASPGLVPAAGPQTLNGRIYRISDTGDLQPSDRAHLAPCLAGEKDGQAGEGRVSGWARGFWACRQSPVQPTLPCLCSAARRYTKQLQSQRAPHCGTLGGLQESSQAAAAAGSKLGFRS